MHFVRKRWQRFPSFIVILLVLLVLFSVLLAVAPTEAVDLNAIWPGLNLPGFKVTPFFSERGEYETNVLLQRRKENADIITKSIPGVVVELPFGRHRLDLGARAEILRFLDNDRLDNEHYFLLGNLALDFPGGLRARLKDEFVLTSDPPGTELTGRIDSTTNTVAPDVEYAIVRGFAVGANYAWTRVDFQASVQALDRDEHTMGVSGFWKVAPKTDLLANYSYGLKTFSSATDRDVTRHILMVGVRGDITSRLSSTFRIGYERRQTDQSGLTGYSGPVASGDWVFAPTERTRFTLLTQRSVEESVFSTNLIYVATLATLMAEQKFGPKLTINGRLFGGTNDYPDKAEDLAKVPGNRFHRRTDLLMGFGAGVEYQIQRWLGFSADYSWTERNSNFDLNDYTNQVFGVKATFSF
jgi:hypothetical protein